MVVMVVEEKPKFVDFWKKIIPEKWAIMMMMIGIWGVCPYSFHFPLLPHSIIIIIIFDVLPEKEGFLSSPLWPNSSTAK